jgi:hypothetical protein
MSFRKPTLSQFETWSRYFDHCTLARSSTSNRRPETPVPSPVVLGQITERFRAAVKELARAGTDSIYEFRHKQDKDEIANEFRRQRGTRDGIVFIGVAQEKAQAFNGKKINGQFHFDRDKTVYVNHYYFYIDDEEFGPLFLKMCSYAPWALKLCLNGHEWAKRQLEQRKIRY